MTRLLFVLLGLSLSTVDTGGIYYGSLKDCKKPAQLVAKTVFAKIPEYQEIQNKGLDDTHPEYWSLLAKANDKFYKAVRKVAEKEKYDVVVEKGSVDKAKNSPDITKKVIKALPK